MFPKVDYAMDERTKFSQKRWNTTSFLKILCLLSITCSAYLFYREQILERRLDDLEQRFEKFLRSPPANDLKIVTAPPTIRLLPPSKVAEDTDDDSLFRAKRGTAPECVCPPGKQFIIN